MKKFFHRTSLWLLTTCISAFAIAQEKGLDIDIDINKKKWYEEPWALVVGGAVVLVLIVLAVRKRS